MPPILFPTAQASAYSFPDEARTATRTTSGKLSLSPTASAALLSTFARSTRGTAATSSTSALSPSSQQNSSPSYPDVNNVTPPYPEPQPGYTERETEFVLTADGPVNMKYQNQLQNEIQDQMTERETEFDLTAFGPVKVVITIQSSSLSSFCGIQCSAPNLPSPQTSP